MILTLLSNNNSTSITMYCRYNDILSEIIFRYNNLHSDNISHKKITKVYNKYGTCIPFTLVIKERFDMYIDKPMA